jgi:mRNA interferase HigB
MKLDYPSASVISGKRTVFNIKGDAYRLVVDIEYKIGIIFIVWFGTHGEYDKINVKTITYVKSN